MKSRRHRPAFITAHFQSVGALKRYLAAKYDPQTILLRGEDGIFPQTKNGLARLCDSRLTLSEKTRLCWIAGEVAGSLQRATLRNLQVFGIIGDPTFTEELRAGIVAAEALQHYGLPTDFIDFTSSIDVALGFAAPKQRFAGKWVIGVMDKAKVRAAGGLLFSVEDGTLFGKRAERQRAWTLSVGEHVDLKDPVIRAVFGIEWFSVDFTLFDRFRYSKRCADLLDPSGDEDADRFFVGVLDAIDASSGRGQGALPPKGRSISDDVALRLSRIAPFPTKLQRRRTNREWAEAIFWIGYQLRQWPEFRRGWQTRLRFQLRTYLDACFELRKLWSYPTFDMQVERSRWFCKLTGRYPLSYPLGYEVFWRPSFRIMKTVCFDTPKSLHELVFLQVAALLVWWKCIWKRSLTRGFLLTLITFGVFGLLLTLHSRRIVKRTIGRPQAVYGAEAARVAS